MSKAIVIKDLDASGSPLGKINFVIEPQDLTSQIKWMGLNAGQSECRLFSFTNSTSPIGELVQWTADIPIQFISYGGSIGFLDVTQFQGATIELRSYPYNVGDNRYYHICFANAVSDEGTTPIVDEGLDIIPMSATTHNNAIHTIYVYKDAATSDQMRTVQLVVPTVASGRVYFIFTNVTKETEFSGYVKIV